MILTKQGTERCWFFQEPVGYKTWLGCEADKENQVKPNRQSTGFKGVRRRKELKIGVTTSTLTITARGAVTMLMIAVMRSIVKRSKDCWKVRSGRWKQEGALKEIYKHPFCSVNNLPLHFCSERIRKTRVCNNALLYQSLSVCSVLLSDGSLFSNFYFFEVPSWLSYYCLRSIGCWNRITIFQTVSFVSLAFRKNANKANFLYLFLARVYYPTRTACQLAWAMTCATEKRSEGCELDQSPWTSCNFETYDTFSSSRKLGFSWVNNNESSIANFIVHCFVSDLSLL